MTDPPLFEQPDCCEACGRPFASSRRDDPSTSTEAGDEIDIFEGPVGSIRRGTHRHRLLAQYAVADLNAGEATQRAALRYDGNSAWKRVSELRQGGHITETGEKRPDPMSGKDRQVYEITDKGREVLEDFDRQQTFLLDGDDSTEDEPC